MDLDEAIALGRDAIGFARRWSVPIHEKVCWQHLRLGTVLGKRYLLWPSVQEKFFLRDIKDAIAHFMATVPLYPKMRHLMLMAKSQLGVVLNTRHNLTGNVESLDDCIA